MFLSIFNCIISITSTSQQARSALTSIYHGMLIATPDKASSLNYYIDTTRQNNTLTYHIKRDNLYLTTNDLGEFIYLFEKDMTIELQKIRHDLVFFHAAALTYNGNGFLLVAPSGSGKSTTTWAMINTGFNYLSDELAPIDIKTMHIHAFPHAINLKARPPLYDLPEDALHTSQTIHVPTHYTKLKLEENPSFLRTIFFLEHKPELKEPEIIQITNAEAATGLYINCLNALAHDSESNGLKTIVEVANKTRSYHLKSGNLSKTCTAVKNLLLRNAG